MRFPLQRQRLLMLGLTLGLLVVIAYLNTHLINNYSIRGTPSAPGSPGVVLHFDPDPYQQGTDVSPFYVVNSTTPGHPADGSKSKVTLHHVTNRFQLGDDIKVRITLYDVNGHRKTTGGDLLRIMIREEEKGARAAGHVIDHHNGSYTGIVKALWTGSPKIEVAIAAPREVYGAFYRIFHEGHNLKPTVALFQNDNIKEQTPCLTNPNIPGYKKVCNLTAENYGLPWYCGKPSHRSLLCHDFTALRGPYDNTVFFTPQEAKLFHRDRLHQRLPDVVKIRVISEKDMVPLPSIPCNQTPLRRSWEARTPVGFFYKNNWLSLTCRNTMTFNADRYRKCLKGRQFWTHGDSTSRYWFNMLGQLLRLSLATEPWPGPKWHKPAVMLDSAWNISVFLVPHEYPFYHGPEFNKLTYNRATHAYLDELPNDTRDIFIIHIFLHLHFNPPEEFGMHMKRIARAVKELVARAPNVKLAIRGPHAFTAGGKVGILDDCWGPVYETLLRKAFKGLEDHVLYLDNMDLTITTGNSDQHPLDSAVKILLNHLMGTVCD